ncbi:MAG TPA: class I SAM-dependent methyltransferase [Thermoanaerobaculia bacterium]
MSRPAYFRAPAARLVALLAPARGARFLDLGAGTGAVSRAARRRTREVVGCDPSLAMLRQGGAGGGSGVAGALPALPFADRAFTHVGASFVLSHLADPVAALVEVRRVLARGGRCGLTAWAADPSESAPGLLWAVVAGEHFGAASGASAATSLPSEAALTDPARLAACLEGAGFAVEIAAGEQFAVAISLARFLASRAISARARSLRAAVPPSRWRRFERDAGIRLAARFGRSLRFETRVNFAIGVVGERLIK